MLRLAPLPLLTLAVALATVACGDDDDAAPTDGAPPTPDGGRRPRDGGPPPPPPPPAEGFPDGNEWSWNGGWAPADTDFPIPRLLDDEYHDGHPGRDGMPTPILPPGAWDWSDPDNDLANWRNFRMNRGDLVQLRDSMDRHYGWRYVPNPATGGEYTGAATYFHGSSGPDLVDLGPTGSIHSFEGDLRDGPDVLVFDRAWSIHFRTGSSGGGSERDDDLVIAGCGSNPDGAWDITTTTIHTGPGHDWVFVRDLSRAGIDLGNGEGGRSDTVDPRDGDDLVVIRGNSQDFRMSGGRGDDVFVWFVDENVQTTTWLGANFFGGGGHGDALWGDPGTDRIVLAVPADTRVVTAPPTPEGGILVMTTDGALVLDDPTQDDVFARYCVECGTASDGRKTVVVEYNSADGMVRTGYNYLTAIEELQIGVGPGARVLRLDQVAGTASEAPELEPFDPPVPPPELCE